MHFYPLATLLVFVASIRPVCGQPGLSFFGQPVRFQKSASKDVIAISPDEQTLLFESGIGQLYKKSLTDEDPPRPVFKSTYKFRCIAYSDDGQRFAIADELNVSVFHTGDSQPQHQIPCALATSIALSSDGKWLAVGLNSGHVKVYDAMSGKIVRTLAGVSATGSLETGPCWALCFSPTGKELLTAGPDQHIRVWAVGSWRLLNTLRGHTGNVVQLAIRADGRLAVSLATDNEFRVWDINKGQCVAVSNDRELFDGITFMADSNYVVTSSFGRTVELWRLKPQERKARKVASILLPVRSETYPPDKISHIQAVRKGLNIGLTTSSSYYRIVFNDSKLVASVDSGKSRLALVIGNSNYAIDPLEGIPLNDARAMKLQLEKLGFAVTLKLDVPADSLRRVVSAFRRTIRRTTRMALFYYAGHGLQLGGQNYILPVDIEVDSSQIVQRSLSINQLVDSVSTTRPQLSLFILDACRDNLNRSIRWPRGLPPSRGFRPILLSETTTSDTYIALATEPGRSASNNCLDYRHSCYTNALLTHLKQGRQVEDVFQLTRTQVMKETRNNQKPELISRSNSRYTF